MSLFRSPFQAMGTQCEIQLFFAEHRQVKPIADIVIADVNRLESLYSRYKSTVCYQGLIRSQQLEVVLQSMRKRLGCGILRQAWRFETGQLPDEPLTKKLLEKVGWLKLRWQAGIHHPRQKQALATTLALHNGAGGGD
ncbi:hypothetical protein [Methylomonas albis]|uniref:hypothetical protein n=1 Tax=Methylomonas albis TaxID=1854563 RepID=UPI002D21BB12|nr:hypothetical protein [Methylomonas albis]